MNEIIIEWEAKNALIYIARLLMADGISYRYVDGSIFFSAPHLYVNDLRKRLRNYTTKRLIIKQLNEQ